SKDRAPIRCESIQFQSNNIEMVGVACALTDGQGLDLGNPGEGGVVAPRDRPAASQPTRELTQLTDAQRALEIGETVVVAEVDHLVEPRALRLALAMVGGDPVIAKSAHLARQPLVIG